MQFVTEHDIIFFLTLDVNVINANVVNKAIKSTELLRTRGGDFYWSVFCIYENVNNTNIHSWISTIPTLKEKVSYLQCSRSNIIIMRNISIESGNILIKGYVIQSLYFL